MEKAEKDLTGRFNVWYSQHTGKGCKDLPEQEIAILSQPFEEMADDSLPANVAAKVEELPKEQSSSLPSGSIELILEQHEKQSLQTAWVRRSVQVGQQRGGKGSVHPATGTRGGARNGYSNKPSCVLCVPFFLLLFSPLPIVFAPYIMR